MKRLGEIIGGAAAVSLFLVILALMALVSCLRWVMMVGLQSAACLGLSTDQRHIMLQICTFVSARADEQEAMMLQKMMWLPGDRAPYYRPHSLLDQLDDRRRSRYRLLSKARHNGIPAWRIRMARCVV